MLLEYFTLIFNTVIVLPYILKLRQITFINFNYFSMFLVGLAIHYFIFFICLNIKKVGKFLLLWFSGVIYAWFGISLFIFGYKFDKTIVASALENETELIFNYINFKTIILGVLFIAIIFLIIKKIKINKKISLVCFPISAIIIVILLIFTKITDNKIYFKSHPVISFFDLFGMGRAIEGLNSQDISDRVFEKDIKELNKHFKYEGGNNDLNVILVIGESARSDYFNKYATILNRENVINFKKSKSSYFLTRYAVPEILKLKVLDQQQQYINYSLVSIMNSLNFNTYWIGAQSIRGRNDSPYAHFVLDSDVRIYRDSNREIKYDLELIDFLDEVLERNKNKKGNNFYIFHQFGSHPRFSKRFEKQYVIYENYCKENMAVCSDEETHNSYANSIVYTDEFLKQLMERFKNKNTILFFTSDHATDLAPAIVNGEDKTIIPIFVWLNGDAIKHRNTLEKNALKDPTFNHQKVVESILDCIGVESDLIDKKDSICSENYK